MPNPSDYDSESDWMADCVPTMIDEGSSQDQAVAACLNMWRERGKGIKVAPALTQRAYSTLTVKTIDQDHRIIEGIASTPEPDRLGDVVESMGAKFSLPMPLLWQHKHDQPVGHVVSAQATAKSITFKAKLAKIDEPGELKSLVDKAWQSVKAGLVRGVSIGFKPREHAFLDNGGIRFSAWDWYELSLVTIPANQAATISIIKSLDLPAASGQADDTRPGASGIKPVNLKLTERPMSKTITEQIAALEATRAAKAARLNEIMTKSIEAGRSTEKDEQDDFDGLEREVEQIDGDLKRLRVLERLNLAKATTVSGVKTVQEGADARGGNGPVRITSPNLEPGIRFTRVVKCLGMAQGNRAAAAQMAEAMYGDDQGIVNVAKAAVAAGTTTSATWAGALVGEEGKIFADFVEFLRPMTILGKFGAGGVPSLRRVPFRVALIGQTTGGSGYWVGEGQAKPLTQFAFERRTLEPLKVANIAVVTEEVLRDSSPSAETILRDSLAAALAERLDIDFIATTKAAVANVSPASITNGVTPIASSGNDETAVRADILAVMRAFSDADNPPTAGVWIMSATTALALQLMVNPLGQVSFPGVSMNGGTFFGMPVIVSEHVQTSGSPNARIAILVNASDIYLGDDGGISIDMSREASLQMDNAPTMTSASLGSPQTPAATSVVSMFQTNSVAFRAERTINWLKRRATAVQVLSGVAWGT